MLQRRRFYLAVGLAILLAFGFLAISLASYFVTQNSFASHIAEESLPLTSDNIYSEIERDLLRSILISSLMAHDTFVRDWALAGEKEPGRIVRYLEEVRKKHGVTTAFFVSDRTLRYYHPDGVLRRVDPDEPLDAWYFRVREMNDPYEINVDTDTSDRSRITIFVNYRVLDYEGDYIGATGIGLSVERVARLIESYQKRYAREIYFVDREGNLTVRGSGYEGVDRIQERPGLRKLSTRVLTNPSTATTYERPDGETVYLNSRLVPEFDWFLIVEQTKPRSEARVLRALGINVFVALSITGLVLIIAYVAVRDYQRRLEQMATIDKLTGAVNRQAFDIIFEHVTSLARRRGQAVSMISIDIDRLKEVNDTYGHQGGDLVLQKFAEVARRHIREVDTFCRWGGDEFLILLGDCPLESAVNIAEKIRHAIREERVYVGGEGIGVTVSLGVAQYRDNEKLDAFIQRVDRTLYRSKGGGRDSVTAFGR